MSSLMVNSISKQDEEDIETAKVQIQGHLNEVRKLINSETNSLNNVMANIVTLQTELDMVRVYTTEKRSYFENESLKTIGEKKLKAISFPKFEHKSTKMKNKQSIILLTGSNNQFQNYESELGFV